MSGSNYSFSSGANTGLNFSNNDYDDASRPVATKTPARMAGDIFAEDNSSSNTSNSLDTSTTGKWWRNQYSDMVEDYTNTNQSARPAAATTADYGSTASPSGPNDGNFTVPGLKRRFNTQAEADAAAANLSAENSAAEARRAASLASQKPFNMQEFMMTQYGKWKQDNVSTDPNAPN